LPLEPSKLLIRTKLHAPSIRTNQVPRPRLLSMLNAGNDKKLILVSAPAGYGKTALVSTWLNETGTRGAWLSLDAGDNDPLRFLQYMLGAIEAVVPAIGVDLLDILKSAQPGKYESVLDSLTNELALIPGRLVLVLDDFHLINSEDVVRFVLHLLEHLPEEKAAGHHYSN